VVCGVVVVVDEEFVVVVGVVGVVEVLFVVVPVEVRAGTVTVSVVVVSPPQPATKVPVASARAVAADNRLMTPRRGRAGEVRSRGSR